MEKARIEDLEVVNNDGPTVNPRRTKELEAYRFIFDRKMVRLNISSGLFLDVSTCIFLVKWRS